MLWKGGKGKEGLKKKGEVNKKQGRETWGGVTGGGL